MGSSKVLPSPPPPVHDGRVLPGVAVWCRFFPQRPANVRWLPVRTPFPSQSAPGAGAVKVGQVGGAARQAGKHGPLVAHCNDCNGHDGRAWAGSCKPGSRHSLHSFAYSSAKLRLAQVPEFRRQAAL